MKALGVKWLLLTPFNLNFTEGKPCCSAGIGLGCGLLESKMVLQPMWTFLKLLNSSQSPLNTQCWQRESELCEGSGTRGGERIFCCLTPPSSAYSPFSLRFSLKSSPCSPQIIPCMSLPSGGAHKSWNYQKATLPLARLQWRVGLEGDLCWGKWRAG